MFGCGHVCICENTQTAFQRITTFFFHPTLTDVQNATVTQSRVRWNNKTTEFTKSHFICKGCAEGTTAAYSRSARGYLLFCLLRVSRMLPNWFQRLMMGKYWVFPLPEINVWFKSLYNLHWLFLALIVCAHLSGWIKKNNNNLRMPSAQSGTLLCTCLRINQSVEDREPCSDPQWKHEQHINTQAKSYEKQTSIHTHFHCAETN